jgi:hypothetical protein
MSQVRRNRARPAVRKRTESGSSISDWQIASQRLEAKEAFQIARKLDFSLVAVSVSGRLRRIGFPPGKPCLFFRGEPVTEKLLKVHFEDLKLLRTSRPLLFRVQAQAGLREKLISTAEAAEFLGVTKSWIREHTRVRCKYQIPHSRSGTALLFKADELLRWALERRNGKNKFLTTFQVERELGRRLGLSRHRIYEFIFRQGGPRNPRNNTHRSADHPLSLIGAQPTGFDERFTRRV